MLWNGTHQIKGKKIVASVAVHLMTAATFDHAQILPSLSPFSVIAQLFPDRLSLRYQCGMGIATHLLMGWDKRAESLPDLPGKSNNVDHLVSIPSKVISPRWQKYLNLYSSKIDFNPHYIPEMSDNSDDYCFATLTTIDIFGGTLWTDGKLRPKKRRV
ncbi:hypothetical protein B0H13DRAFT_1899371 [Mycena leptocephala]|nr:hypothetical protein B0H13DRAFT_1899371 [Mycena leptocephala]